MTIYNYLFIVFCVTDWETEMFRTFLNKNKTDASNISNNFKG